MKLNRNEMIEPFNTSEVKRPWGYYGLYADNVKSTTKILYVKPGECLSLQYHFRRDQEYLILDNSFVVEYSKIPIPKEIAMSDDDDFRTKELEKFLSENMISQIALEGDIFGFHRFVVHRVKYIGDAPYGKILDIAFGENDENDIVRIKDKYSRGKIDG
jgi:hypothetical protein